MGMRKSACFAFAMASLLTTSCTLDDVLNGGGGGGGGSTQDQVVKGLRTVLSVGIDSSAAFAGQVDGYLAHAAIKILLPDDAVQAMASAQAIGAYVGPYADKLQSIQTAAQAVGLYQGAFAQNLSRASAMAGAAASLQTLGDSVVKYMNRAAERAAPRSVPIFKSAITSLTISDGLSLLNSADSTAATAYLSGQTFHPLTLAYRPLVDSTLALVPLTQYWGDFRTAYNALVSDYKTLLDFQTSWNSNALVASVPALQVDGLEPLAYQPIKTESLGEWTTEKALTGLFWLIGGQEKDIRRDPIGYVRNLAVDVADLLEQVFGEVMHMGTSPAPAP